MSDIPGAATPPIDLFRTFSLEQKKDQPIDRAKLVQMAQEFESMLLLQMVRQMRQSISFDDQESREQGFGNETMTDTFDVEFSHYLAKAGGVGLGQMIERQFMQQQSHAGAASAPTAAAAPGDATPASAPTPAPASITTLDKAVAQSASAEAAASEAAAGGLTMPLDSHTTSGFGWRQDPLGHGRRFHSGVDLRAAYGTEVPAAAAGEVTFAGDQGGYGTTVVVRHDDGLETRYAHLSSTEVQAGDRVDAGQALGRVGSSGRSTGPHLHFEVRRNGQQVDPAAVTGPHAATFKFVTGVDDSLHERMVTGDAPASVASNLGVENEDPGRQAR